MKDEQYFTHYRVLSEVYETLTKNRLIHANTIWSCNNNTRMRQCHIVEREDVPNCACENKKLLTLPTDRYLKRELLRN